MSTLEDLIRITKEIEKLSAELADALFQFGSEKAKEHTTEGGQQRITESAITVFQKRMERKDPIAVGINHLCQQHGLQVRNSKEEGSITCVTTLDRIFAMSSSLLDRTLYAVTHAWGHKADALRGDILEGVALFLMAYQGVDVKLLAEELSGLRNGPRGVIASAQILQRGNHKTRTRAIADLIADIYTS